MHKLLGWITPEVRNWIYGVSMAIIPLLITLGALSEGVAKDVALIVSAVLGFTTNAVAKTNVTSPTATPAETEFRG